MLCLISICLVFELGFNACLLDVAVGSATHDEVDHIEKYGRIISGVALTLLFWGFPDQEVADKSGCDCVLPITATTPLGRP